MILVDHERCGYCGGCVSVCPVGAIELAALVMAGKALSFVPAVFEPEPSTS